MILTQECGYYEVQKNSQYKVWGVAKSRSLNFVAELVFNSYLEMNQTFCLQSPNSLQKAKLQKAPQLKYEFITKS